MMRRRYGVLVALAALPLVLAACGGGGTSSEDQNQITKAVEFAATSGDPKACTEAQTQKFTEQTTGASGQAAVAQCVKDAPDTPADTVDVTSVEVDGDSATADAGFNGGVFNGQTVSLKLVKEGDTWKLDEATGFKDFDRDKFIASFKTELSSQQGIPPGAADCVGSQLEKLSDSQVEDLFLNSNTQLEQQVFSACFKGE
jgi:ABC-type glycerol-3-phosphate transport system substrate-binding protein